MIISFSMLGSICGAEPAFLDEMDSDQPVLRLVEKTDFRVVSQYVERDEHLTGTGAEVVKLQGPAGETAMLLFELPSAPVIAELVLATTISCNRPGVQIAAQVVLPRSVDPQTGRSREVILRGSNLSTGVPGEQIVLANLPQLLDRQTRIARIRSEARIDPREAYVRQLVFLIPGGTGITEIVVDRVELDGIFIDRHDDPAVTPAGAESILVEPEIEPATDQANASPQEKLTRRSTAHSPSQIQRIIRWQGEPFEYLKSLGFNTIWLARPATAVERKEAHRLDLAIVCPPPPSDLLARELRDQSWDYVLAWDLGSLVAADDLDQVIRLKQLIRQHDPVTSRTTVMTCEQLTRDVSRATDALLLGRDILGTDLTLRDYVTWLGQRQRLARPGTPLWTMVPSQISLQRAHQIEALQGSSIQVPPAGASYEQLAAITSAAMSIRSRDFFFESQSSLTAPDPHTRQRARNLELMNLRLRLLTPWLAAGKVAGVVRGTPPVVSAVMLQAERSHLLMPMGWSRNFRSQQESQVSGPVSFIVPGVAESADVYLLSLAGAERVRHERVTGGIKISVDSLPPDGLIMLTSDPQAFSHVSQFLRSIAGRAAQLRHDIVTQRMQELVEVGKEENLDETSIVKPLLSRAEGELLACGMDLKRGFAEQSYRRTQNIERTLSQIEYVLRNQGQPGQVTTPLIFSVTSIAAERRMQDSLSRATVQSELLAGGEFEALQPLLDQGWRHKQLPLLGITSAVRLSPDAPYSGSYCLELEAKSLDPSQPISVVPTAPVWISSAPMRVKAGEIVEIIGMARVPEELIGTVDGLEIIDSLGGPGMATRIQIAPSWQPFRILRCVPSDTSLTVSLALSGIGKAQVDNLVVRKLQLPRELAGKPESLERPRR
ncbi:hypothetical protein [Bythopirellula polymerisocia]|uniref:hypothetical protein n=1 Tax=Bythopirellula polymerisocia TaxID=2528003 RepID=UPI0011B461E7|nr:hypothetical protein [Bythopirellula polymerisocia]